MGIRNLLARLPLLGRDVLLTYAVILGAVYALPIYVVARQGPPADVIGWTGLIVWGWGGTWFVKGVILGGFNGTEEDLAADVDRRDVDRRNVDARDVNGGSVEAAAVAATAAATADVTERPQR
jgi:hypothetical protein